MATTTKKPKKQDWREKFKLEFPQFAGMVDGAEGEAKARSLLGDDLINLFFDLAQNPDKYDLSSQAGREAWAAKVQGTKLYTANDENRRKWAVLGEPDRLKKVEDKVVELRNTYGQLELNDQQLRDLATYTLSTGASELQTSYYAYSIISDRQVAKGAPPTVGETDAATNLREQLKRYNYAPPGVEDQIRSALTGKAYLGTVYTPDLLMKKAKDSAKIMYSQFSDQFDKGYTMDDIFEPYRNIAAKTLEINPDDIKVNDPKFQVVFNKKADGTSMTADDFIYLLRKDPKYGWGKTRQAKDMAANLIQTLEKAWGQMI